ncbi:MAG: ATP synthase F1 subunit epsilon [Chloroflexi bacterium]|nr:ATP synthase F1 subunit epsilon [Chloroflexota bacterium]|tara:strand:+ start:2245 stop:2499 length:255 start_codon:yes stop_codon:yes gene_type:complete
MASLKLEIVTSEETVFNGNVDYVSVISTDGQIGILPNHISLISELDKGNLMWRDGNKENDVIIDGGFIEVIDNSVTILVDGTIN